ncbi:hypothetical protein BVRB_033870, partial [Beta vulgaris subsp. vulgaris]
MALMAEEQAELAFMAHDWEADAVWKAKLSQVYISNSADQNLALMRLKRKYFKSEINSNLSLDPPKDNSTDQTQTPDQTSSKTYDFGRRLRISANYLCFFLHAFNLLAALG